MVRNITLRVLAYLLFLIVLVVATCSFLSEGEYIPGVATSILAVGCCFRVVWNVRSVTGNWLTSFKPWKTTIIPFIFRNMAVAILSVF